jgi:TonB family protein
MIPLISNALALVAAASLAAPSTPSARPGKWVVDWGEQRCSLIRETGGEAPVTLMVRTVPGAGQAELWLFDPKWAGPDFTGFEEVDVSLQPSGFRGTESALSVRFRGLKGIAVTSLDEAFLKKLGGSAKLRIDRGRRTLADIRLPGSARAFASLQACEATVLRDWGFDPEVMASLSRTPRPVVEPARWFSAADYPMQAVRARLAGSVLTRLIIGADGRVAECFVVEGSGAPVLDRRTCELLLRRGRYEPALTASGEPVRAMSSVRIHWVLARG